MKETSLRRLQATWCQLHNVLEKAQLWRNWLPRAGGRETEWTQEALGVSEAILYDTVIMDTCHYTFVQAHRTYDTKGEAYVNDSPI